MTPPGPETTDRQREGLDTAQLSAHGDMPIAELRAALHRTADMVADYIEHVEDYPDNNWNTLV